MTIQKLSLQNSKPKIRVGILFGGRSVEHEVSIVSAASVIEAIDKNKYEVIPIAINPEGIWLSEHNAIELLKNKFDLKKINETILLPNPNYKKLATICGNKISWKNERLDVIFPILHGTYGEDGTIQGLLELSDIPYVGAGVLASALGMDKIVAKQLFEQWDIPVTPYTWFLWTEYKKNKKEIISLIEKKLGYPCFVKPSNLGSSVGITKAQNRKELQTGIQLAAEYDRKILVEKSVENGREIEIGVLGNNDPIVSVPGEIIPSNEFYNYNAKYVNGKSVSIIPAKIPTNIVSKLQEYAIRGFKAIDCAGMARVDFFVTKRSNKIFLNEINTIPGFTSISMYPKLWEVSGISYPKLIERLIELALEHHRIKDCLKRTYKPKKEWFKK